MPTANQTSYKVAIQKLEGICRGIQADGVINDAEVETLSSWLAANDALTHLRPFDSLVTLLRQILADQVITEEERIELEAWMDQFLDGSSPYRIKTNDAIRVLHGLLHGIRADDVINEEEATALGSWLVANETHAGVWPINEVVDHVESFLAANDATSHGRLLQFCERLSEVDSATVGTRGRSEQELTDGRSLAPAAAIYTPGVSVDFEGYLFCFTGQPESYTKDQLADLVRNLGGNVHPRVTKKVDFLVVGGAGDPAWAFGNYGTKVAKAIKYREKGCDIAIVSEETLIDAISGASF